MLPSHKTQMCNAGVAIYSDTCEEHIKTVVGGDEELHQLAEEHDTIVQSYYVGLYNIYTGTLFQASWFVEPENAVRAFIAQT